MCHLGFSQLSLWKPVFWDMTPCWPIFCYPYILSSSNNLQMVATNCSESQQHITNQQGISSQKAAVFKINKCDVYFQDLKTYMTLEGPCIIFCNIYTFQRDTQCCRVPPQTLYQWHVPDSAVLTTYHSLHIQHLKRSSWGRTVTVRNMYSWHLCINKQLVLQHCVSRWNVYISKNILTST